MDNKRAQDGCDDKGGCHRWNKRLSPRECEHKVDKESHCICTYAHAMCPTAGLWMKERHVITAPPKVVLAPELAARVPESPCGGAINVEAQAK